MLDGPGDDALINALIHDIGQTLDSQALDRESRLKATKAACLTFASELRRDAKTWPEPSRQVLLTIADRLSARAQATPPPP